MDHLKMHWRQNGPILQSYSSNPDRGFEGIKVAVKAFPGASFYECFNKNRVSAGFSRLIGHFLWLILADGFLFPLFLLDWVTNHGQIYLPATFPTSEGFVKGDIACMLPYPTSHKKEIYPAI